MRRHAHHLGAPPRDGRRSADGATHAAGAQGLVSGIESVQEFTVLTNTYSAEYGRAAGGVFNIATGIETSVAAVWETLRDAASSGIEPELAPLRRGELTRSCMDPTNAFENLGWKASIPIYDGLRDTYAGLVAEFEEEACRQ